MVSRFRSGRSVRTLIVVTSKVHSAWARRILAAGLGPKVALVIHPVPADPFDPGRWWQDRMDFRQAVWEFAALVHVLRRGLWDPVMRAFDGLLLTITRLEDRLSRSDGG
jgi:hypothetical protein